MSATIKPLIDFINDDKLQEIYKNYIYNVNIFNDKYKEKIIRNITDSISKANLEMIWKSTTWNLSVDFLEIDILSIDKNYYECIYTTVNFLKNICKDLRVECKNVAFKEKNMDRMFFSLEIENPILKKLNI